MFEAMRKGSAAVAIRLERGHAEDAEASRIARGSGSPFGPSIAWGKPHFVRAPLRETMPVPLAETAGQLTAREKAAFTLRLDPVRHARLKQACSQSSRSAQQLVTQALDAFLGAAGGAAFEPRPAGAAIRSGGF